MGIESHPIDLLDRERDLVRDPDCEEADCEFDRCSPPDRRLLAWRARCGGRLWGGRVYAVVAPPPGLPRKRGRRAFRSWNGGGVGVAVGVAVRVAVGGRVGVGGGG